LATEIYAFENGALRKLTGHNDALLAEVRLGAVEDMVFRSKDGAEIHGLIVKPPDAQAGKKYPALLWIHGGPNMQDDHALTFGLYPLQLERQLLAARGYVVLAVNYRGSSGFGSAFTGAFSPTGATRKWTICSPAWRRPCGSAWPIRTGSGSAAGATAAF
jgi:dipeptidyl aminopeptidase/acylaminoacyl peptidase